MSYTFKEYEEGAWETMVYPNIGNNLYYPALGLAGEAGECCDKIKKVMRDDGGVLTVEKKHALQKEIGDIMWYLSALCFEMGTTMEICGKENLEKLRSRKERGVLHGSGDNR